jgi:hypothetical protein
MVGQRTEKQLKQASALMFPEPEEPLWASLSDFPFAFSASQEIWCWESLSLPTKRVMQSFKEKMQWIHF